MQFVHKSLSSIKLFRKFRDGKALLGIHNGVDEKLTGRRTADAVNFSDICVECGTLVFRSICTHVVSIENEFVEINCRTTSLHAIIVQLHRPWLRIVVERDQAAEFFCGGSRYEYRHLGGSMAARECSPYQASIMELHGALGLAARQCIVFVPLESVVESTTAFAWTASGKQDTA
jgi:hypothetical protein